MLPAASRLFSAKVLIFLAVAARTVITDAQTPDLARLARLVPDTLPGYRQAAHGATRLGTPLIHWYSDVDLDATTDRTRILLVGGLDGTAQSTTAVHAALRWFQSADCPTEFRRRFAVSAAPLANPDGISRDRGSVNLSGGDPAAQYPPDGPYYGHPTVPEATYLWRWLGTFAPDLVVVVASGSERAWHVPPAEQLGPWGALSGGEWGERLASRLAAARAPVAPASLVAALGRTAPSDMGTIPTVILRGASDPDAPVQLRSLLEACSSGRLTGPSPARAEWQRRLARSPIQVLQQLSRHYGQSLPVVEYIPAVALVGRLRLGRLTNDPAQRTEVLRIVDEYVRGDKDTTPKSGSGQSGHLIFSELARDAQGPARDRLIALVRVAADQAFGPNGEPLEAMPFHLEMSDAFFMAGPILAAAGHLTGEARYFAAAERHRRFMVGLDRRADGLYRHSPLDDTAWGRGNGFVALGCALSLTDWPTERDDRKSLLAQHAAHLQALLKHQDPAGCWHQVIDHPESYAELSCTCMITWALARGVRGGWLDRVSFDPAIRQGWQAIRQRVATDGRLIDVCTGTGKQKSLRDYLDREAILGLDPRGGAMAMLVAAELADYLEASP